MTSVYIPGPQHYEIESFIERLVHDAGRRALPGLTPDLLRFSLSWPRRPRGACFSTKRCLKAASSSSTNSSTWARRSSCATRTATVVVGHDFNLQLKARRMASPDIRAGIALLIAALSADGTSRIDNVGQIDRGYEHIEDRLNALGACITRLE